MEAEGQGAHPQRTPDSSDTAQESGRPNLVVLLYDLELLPSPL